jgi:hypothetical protein
MSLNIHNLNILADYLDSLPDDYTNFDMHYFASDYPEVSDRPPCGCAVGHGPAAGLLPAECIGGCWTEYAEVVFFNNEYHDCIEYWFMFGDGWENDPKLAAARIRHVIKHGVPEGFHERMAHWGENPSTKKWLSNANVS